MFIKRNCTSIGDKAYASVLLVQGKRVPAKRPPGRPRADESTRKTVVVHETLANLSKLPADLVALIESYCRGSAPASPPPAPGDDSKPTPGTSVHVGPCYGVLAGLHALAKELGIVRAVGDSTRLQRLALFLIYARIAHQGSRLSAARWSEDHAVREILEVGAFDEDDLYAALEYLESQQKTIELALAKAAPKGAMFLYDVTSVYFEGTDNEWAEFGYNRDGKKGKKQMVTLRQAQGRLSRYRLTRWIKLALAGRKVEWSEDLPAKEAQGQLDGCYVVETDLPAESATTEAVHERYMDLTKVERDFRTLKTGLLEIRPVFLRKANRTRGHALVSLLALKVARELDRRVAPLGLEVDDAVERLKGVRLVCLGDPQHKLWRLAESDPRAQQEVLEKLPKLPVPMLSLGKANKNRLTNARQGRV